MESVCCLLCVCKDYFNVKSHKHRTLTCMYRYM